MDRINAFVQNFNSEEDFNYSVHISEVFDLIYFSNPKTACTLAKASINVSYAKSLGLTHEFRAIGDIHDREYNLLKTPQQVGYQKFLDMLIDNTVMKVCFARDPFSRLASAYASKIDNSDSIAENLRSRFKVPAPTQLSHAVTFERFVHLIAEDTSFRDCDEHWRLQKKQVCADLVPQMVIGRQETANTDLMAVLTKVFGSGCATLIDVRHKFPDNQSNSKEVERTSNELTRQLVREAYAEDYSWLTCQAKME